MKRIVPAAVVLTALVGLAQAHHSFAKYYFEERSVTIEGDLVSFENRNPHAWVYVEAPDSDGVLRRYAAEWSNPSRLLRDDVTADTLKPGDRVIVTGSPGRTPEEYRLHLKRIERPSDGWNWPNRGARRRR